MKIHHLNNKAIAVTGLPEGATNLEIDDYPILGKCLTWNDNMSNMLPLPEGTWSILGFSQELTDAEKAEYEPLIKSKGLFVINPYAKKRPADSYYPKDRHGVREKIYDGFQLKWEEAELLSNPLILIQ